MSCRNKSPAGGKHYAHLRVGEDEHRHLNRVLPDKDGFEIIRQKETDDGLWEMTIACDDSEAAQQLEDVYR